MSLQTKSPPSIYFKVHRGTPELVKPTEPTPYEFKQLSDIECLDFFKGRLREGPSGKLVVECTAEGVLFTEAYADVTLDQFDYPIVPPLPCSDQLLFDVPGSSGILNSPLMLFQVTRLKCGGFIFGIRVNHTMSDGTGGGTVEEIAGLKCYITASLHSKLAILLISDIFGYEAPNLRKLADKVAAAGFYVVVPDFFYGDPVDTNNPQFDRESWRKVHNAEKGYEDAKQVIAALKSKGASAIGAAGFCWGGRVVVKLASSCDIEAGVVLHPGRLTIDDIKEVKVPISFLGAEFDHASPPEQLKEFGELLSQKSELDSSVKIFPGVHHGWSVRYNLDDESAVKSAEEAHDDMLIWFTKHVK